jgi:hypothetical protein
MKHSQIFHTDAYKRIQKEIVTLMNSHKDFMSETTASSPRAAGDAIQSILADNFQKILGDLCGTYSAQFARRAMADIAFTDKDGFYCVVDVKTHRLDTHFNMPNLTSVERLARFYEDDNNYFVVLSLAYLVKGTKLKIDNVHFIPIEFLSWDCLTIGALGWGQIQIANSNNIVVNPKYSRKKWMLEFCDVMLEFYPKEISKIDSRIKHFQKVRKHWQDKVE